MKGFVDWLFSAWIVLPEVVFWVLVIGTGAGCWWHGYRAGRHDERR